MKRAALFPAIIALTGLWAPAPTGAQPAAPSVKPGDTVIVTGQAPASEKAIENFVQSYAAPSLYLGKIARWKNVACPMVKGIPSDDANLIVQRVRSVAAMVGAPGDANQSCSFNIEVDFTDAPQKLLDDIRDNRPYELGYAKSSSQIRRMAIVSHPIQAWYATNWEDNHGNVHPDAQSDQCGGISVRESAGCGIAASNLGLRTATGGLKSQFYTILIVVDTGKVRDVPVGALADYIAMLALAQTQSFETCQALLSITNLVSPNCPPGTKSASLTNIDLAYLRGVYDTKPDKNLDQQKNDIASAMAKGHAPE